MAEDADTVKMHRKLTNLEARSEYLPPSKLAPKRIAKVSTVGRRWWLAQGLAPPSRLDSGTNLLFFTVTIGQDAKATQYAPYKSRA